MNICLFTSTSDFGGTERMALEFLRGCDRTRFEPSLVCLLGNGRVLEAARAQGIACLGLDWRGWVGGRALRALKRFLRQRRVELLHIFGLRAELVGRLVARRAGVRFVVSGVRDTDPWRRWYHVWADRLTARAVDLFIANSEEARRVTMRREKVAPHKIITIHNGLRLAESGRPTDEEQRRAARRRLGIAEDGGPVVVELANIKIQKKGYDLLLAAAARLKDEFPGLVVLCVGEDYSRGELSRRIAAMGLEGVVRMTGYCAEVSVPLNAADVCALPSRYESFPVSILEAMAAGLPVVASRVGGIPEMITEGVEGFLIEPGDAGALVDRLGRLLRDAGLRARCGAAARRTVEARFTLEGMIRAIEDAYARLAAQP